MAPLTPCENACAMCVECLFLNASTAKCVPLMGTAEAKGRERGGEIEKDCSRHFAGRPF
jgi:hypothetical protein